LTETLEHSFPVAAPSFFHQGCEVVLQQQVELYQVNVLTLVEHLFPQQTLQLQTPVQGFSALFIGVFEFSLKVEFEVDELGVTHQEFVVAYHLLDVTQLV